MKREIVLLASAGLAIIIGATVVQFRSASTPSPRDVDSTPELVETIRWRKELRAAHEESVRTDKPMLLVFEAEWCGHCQKLERETFSESRLRRHVNRAFIPVRLDFDKTIDVAEVLDVTSLPCTVILSPRADLLGRIDGFAEVDDYIAALDRSCRLQLEIGQRMAHTETSASSKDRTY